MGYKSKLIIIKDYVKHIAKKKITRRLAATTYHLYNISRVFRNPFVILEYINCYNVLLLMAKP